jgi:UDP-glucose 4-epimerase
MSSQTAQLRSLRGRRVLVTGASGFLGSHLVERLIAEGAIVAALSRHRGKRLSQSRPGKYLFLACDLTDHEAAQSAAAKFSPEVLFHFAAFPDGNESLPQARGAIAGNLVATVNMLEAFRLCGGGVFIYGDSCKVYGDSGVPYRESMAMDPLSSYAIAKAAGWEFCRQYSRLHRLSCVSLRPTMIYGPRQSFNLIEYVAQAILSGAAEVQLDGGSQTRDPLFVEDAMEAFLEVARRGERLSGRIINLGGGSERTVHEIAAEVARLMESNIPIVCVEGRKRPTDMRRNYCDNAEAAALLGWRPKVGLQEGLARTLSELVHSNVTAVSA